MFIEYFKRRFSGQTTIWDEARSCTTTTTTTAAAAATILSSWNLNGRQSVALLGGTDFWITIQLRTTILQQFWIVSWTVLHTTLNIWFVLSNGTATFDLCDQHFPCECCNDKQHWVVLYCHLLLAHVVYLCGMWRSLCKGRIAVSECWPKCSPFHNICLHFEMDTFAFNT